MKFKKLSLLMSALFVGSVLSQSVLSQPAQQTTAVVVQNNQPVLQARQPVDTNLVKLINDQDIVLSLNPEGLINGNNPVNLSRGIWDDRAVAAYQSKYKRTPLVFPLTTPVDDQTRVLAQDPDYQDKHSSEQKASGKKDDDEKLPDPALFAKANPDDVYYLYVNLPAEPEDQNRLVEKLKVLIDENFQNALDDNGFSKLPKAYLQIWKVKLGMAGSEFPGGDI